MKRAPRGRDAGRTGAGEGHRRYYLHGGTVNTRGVIITGAPGLTETRGDGSSDRSARSVLTHATERFRRVLLIIRVSRTRSPHSRSLLKLTRIIVYRGPASRVREKFDWRRRTSNGYRFPVVQLAQLSPDEYIDRRNSPVGREENLR